MKVIGLTGGIGSGKSTVARMFQELGVPVYIADDEAKKLMNEDKEVRKKIIKLFGDEAYNGSGLNRKFIASKVFDDKELLEKLNSVVHPAVAKHFEKWKVQQKAPYVIYEAAILFEKGGYKKCDYNILVTAPVNLRIERILRRDKVTVEEIQARMNNQWPDEKKEKMADVVLRNIDLSETKKDVLQIHKTFLKSA